jgi:short-subunit dehydrogenase
MDNSTIGLIDTVIFNAGTGHLSPAIETSSTTIDQIWKQTARYPMMIIPLILSSRLSNDHSLNPNNPTGTLVPPILKHIDRPHFVITSSIAAMIPVPLSSVYGAAKAALWSYSRTLQCEYPNLLLHTIMPGPVDTNFFHNPPTTNVQNNNNSKNKNNNKNPIETTLLPQQPSPPNSKTMKMSVHRCVQLMISTMRLSYY